MGEYKVSCLGQTSRKTTASRKRGRGAGGSSPVAGCSALVCVGEGEKGSVRCFPLCCLLCLSHRPPAQSCPLQVHTLRGHQWGTGAAVTRASLRPAGRTRGTEFIAFRAFRKNCLGITGAFYPAECPLPAPRGWGACSHSAGRTVCGHFCLENQSPEHLVSGRLWVICSVCELGGGGVGVEKSHLPCARCPVPSFLHPAPLQLLSCGQSPAPGHVDSSRTFRNGHTSRDFPKLYCPLEARCLLFVCLV